MIKFKTLLMEGAKENAALDYLQQLVRSGPFKGRVYLAGGAVTEKWYENPDITKQDVLHIAKSIVNSQPKTK